MAEQQYDGITISTWSQHGRFQGLASKAKKRCYWLVECLTNQVCAIFFYFSFFTYAFYFRLLVLDVDIPTIHPVLFLWLFLAIEYICHPNRTCHLKHFRVLTMPYECVLK